MNELDVPIVGTIERPDISSLERGHISRLSARGLRMPRDRGERRDGGLRHHVHRRRRGAHLNVCVREEYRCRGLARKVTAVSARSGAQRRNVRGLSRSAAVEYRRGEAVSFLGFEQVGIRRGYYQAVAGREDAQVLRRILYPEAKPLNTTMSAVGPDLAREVARRRTLAIASRIATLTSKPASFNTLAAASARSWRRSGELILLSLR